MPRSPFYGKLDAVNTPSEVKQIWHTRDDELEPLPQHKWSFDYITDLEQVEQRELLVKILEEAIHLNEQHWLVLRMRILGDCTLEEVGQEMGVGRERVRQIEGKMLRILRAVQYKFTGVKVEYFNYEVTTWTWRQWKALRGKSSTLS